jgi:hypothetical protein
MHYCDANLCREGSHSPACSSFKQSKPNSNHQGKSELESAKTEDGLSTPAVIAITGGCIAVVLIVIALCLRKRRHAAAQRHKSWASKSDLESKADPFKDHSNKAYTSTAAPGLYGNPSFSPNQSPVPENQRQPISSHPTQLHPINGNKVNQQVAATNENAISMDTRPSQLSPVNSCASSNSAMMGSDSARSPPSHAPTPTAGEDSLPPPFMDAFKPNSGAGKRVSSMFMMVPNSTSSMKDDEESIAEYNGEQVKAVRNYDPVMSDEMELVVGDILSVTQRYDDGWGHGLNLSTGQVGVFPLNFVASIDTKKRADPAAVPVRQSAYGDLGRLSVIQKSMKMELEMEQNRILEHHQEAHNQLKNMESPSLSSKSAEIPADPSSINALMAVLERISKDEKQELNPEERESFQAKFSRLPPDVRGSIVSQAEIQRFSFSALMSVLDDPQLQHHQSVYLDRKAQLRDTMYSSYTYADESNIKPTTPLPPLPVSPNGSPSQLAVPRG